MRWLLLAFLIGMLCGCGNSHAPAPVINAWLQPEAQTADYIVSKGDTIYSIAWQFGLDYKILARANHLKPPYSIYQGQRLKMTTTARGALKPLAPNPAVLPGAAPVRVTTWQWPAVGKLVRGYSPSLTGNAGINIAGRLGSPVRASLSGEIVYSGSGIRGYGNLIIIKHNSHYLSAYAYNQTILVKLGQHVQTGEPIATMGRDDAGQIMLHFEIRYDGRPVDPTRFLS